MDNTFNAVGIIQTIATGLRRGKLQNTASVEKELTALGEYLGTDQMQTIIFVSIFDRTSSNLNSDVNDISSFFDCSSLEIVANKKDFDRLLFLGLIEKAKRDHEVKIGFTNMKFRVPSAVFEAILSDDSPNVAKAVQGEPDYFEMIKQVGEWLERRDMEDMSTSTFLAQAKELEESFLSCGFVMEVRRELPDLEDRVLYYDICKDNYLDDEHSDLEVTLKDLYDRQSQVLKVMKTFLKEESVLQKCGLVECWKDGDKYSLAPTKRGYELLLGEYADVKLKKTSGLDKFEFVKEVSDSIQQRKQNNYTIFRLTGMIEELEMNNSKLPLVKETKNLLKCIDDRIFFYDMCNDNLSGRTSLDSTLRDMYDKPQKVMEESIKWKNEEHQLQTLGLAEISESSFFSSVKVELTDEGRELFLQEDAAKFKKKDNANLLSVDKIKSKKLYYPPQLKRQVDFLTDSLQTEAFRQLQHRLEEQSLPVGVAAIFYGAPGTGKTETVYQLAKATGRDVLQVDISEMKTCWYGESQKLVKRVFTKYDRLCKKSKNAPVLLFNEADAIFGKRKEGIHGSVDQTENAIQNIILEQMEKLKGILIATTNLESNFDPAFERRFLFKVKFEKPDAGIKTLIWLDKLPQITKADAAALAAEYDFSGGEIDNIVRKATMNTVLTGEGCSLDYLRELCSQEHLSKRSGNIGF